MKLVVHNQRRDRACFFCPQPFTDDEEVVEWRSARAWQDAITLHVKCAARLGVRLINDATRGDDALRDKVGIWLSGSDVTGPEKEG